MNLSNFSQIRHNGKDISLAKLNGEVLWESYDKDFYVEYELYPNDLPINYTYHSVYKANLPTLLLNVMDPSSEVKYSKIEITLNDDTITEDTSVTAREVKSIKLWYPKETGHLMFIGSDEQSPNYIEFLDHINISNLKTFRLMFCNSIYFRTASFSNDFANLGHITDMSRMFYNCRRLGSGLTADIPRYIAFRTIRALDVSNVTDMTETFYNCSYMDSLDLSYWDTRNVLDSDNMLYGVKSTIDWNYDGSNYDNFTLTEEQTGFSGTFPWTEDDDIIVGINFMCYSCGYTWESDMFPSICPLCASHNISINRPIEK